MYCVVLILLISVLPSCASKEERGYYQSYHWCTHAVFHAAVVVLSVGVSQQWRLMSEHLLPCLA